MYSWLIVILVVFFLITIDFLYLCDHINDTIIENGYFKNILTIIISILSSWFISKYLGPFFLNFTSEVGVTNSFGFILIIVALIIPILSGLTQWISIKLTSTASATQTADNPMASQMKMMNVMMPMLSVFMCFTFQAGLGLYWIASAVVRCVQQLIINKHLEKISVDDLIAQNVEKVKKKREKKGASAKNINEMAQRNVRNIQEPSMKKMTDAEKEARLKKAAEANKNAKAGSLASKANMVKNFNENN